MQPRLRDLREDADLNQTQVAKALNMSQTGYSKYETGENDIPTTVLIALADFHETNVDYILNLTNNNTYYKNLQKQPPLQVAFFIKKHTIEINQ